MASVSLSKSSAYPSLDYLVSNNTTSLDGEEVGKAPEEDDEGTSVLSSMDSRSLIPIQADQATSLNPTRCQKISAFACRTVHTIKRTVVFIFRQIGKFFRVVWFKVRMSAIAHTLLGAPRMNGALGRWYYEPVEELQLQPKEEAVFVGSRGYEFNDESMETIRNTLTQFITQGVCAKYEGLEIGKTINELTNTKNNLKVAKNNLLSVKKSDKKAYKKCKKELKKAREDHQTNLARIKAIKEMVVAAVGFIGVKESPLYNQIQNQNKGDKRSAAQLKKLFSSLNMPSHDTDLISETVQQRVHEEVNRLVASNQLNPGDVDDDFASKFVETVIDWCYHSNYQKSLKVFVDETHGQVPAKARDLLLEFCMEEVIKEAVECRLDQLMDNSEKIAQDFESILSEFLQSTTEIVADHFIVRLLTCVGNIDYTRQFDQMPRVLLDVLKADLESRKASVKHQEDLEFARQIVQAGAEVYPPRMIQYENDEGVLVEETVDIVENARLLMDDFEQSPGNNVEEKMTAYLEKLRRRDFVENDKTHPSANQFTEKGIPDSVLAQSIVVPFREAFVKDADDIVALLKLISIPKSLLDSYKDTKNFVEAATPFGTWLKKALPKDFDLSGVAGNAAECAASAILDNMLLKIVQPIYNDVLANPMQMKQMFAETFLPQQRDSIFEGIVQNVMQLHIKSLSKMFVAYFSSTTENDKETRLTGITDRVIDWAKNNTSSLKDVFEQINDAKEAGRDRETVRRIIKNILETMESLSTDEYNVEQDEKLHKSLKTRMGAVRAFNTAIDDGYQPENDPVYSELMKVFCSDIGEFNPLMIKLCMKLFLKNSLGKSSIKSLHEYRDDHRLMFKRIAESVETEYLQDDEARKRLYQLVNDTKMAITDKQIQEIEIEERKKHGNLSPKERQIKLKTAIEEANNEEIQKRFDLAIDEMANYMYSQNMLSLQLNGIMSRPFHAGGWFFLGSDSTRMRQIIGNNYEKIIGDREILQNITLRIGQSFAEAVRQGAVKARTDQRNPIYNPQWHLVEEETVPVSDEDAEDNSDDFQIASEEFFFFPTESN